MLKSFINKLGHINSFTNKGNFTKNFHSCYNPKCFSEVEINSLKTRLFGNLENLKLKNLSVSGLPIKLGFYDSHRFDRRIQYVHSTQPIVIILPSSEKRIQNYDTLIGELVAKKYRVILLEFPGKAILLH